MIFVMIFRMIFSQLNWVPPYLDRPERRRVDQLAQDLVGHAAGRGHVVGGGPEVRRLAVVTGELGRVLHAVGSH